MTLPIGKVLVGLLRCPRLSFNHALVMHQHVGNAVSAIRAEGQFDLANYYALLKGGHCEINDLIPAYQATMWQSVSIWNQPIEEEVALLILVADVTFTKLLDSRILTFVNKGNKVKEDWWKDAIGKAPTTPANYVKTWTAKSMAPTVDDESIKDCTSYLSHDPIITGFAEKVFAAAAASTRRESWEKRASTSIF